MRTPCTERTSDVASRRASGHTVLVVESDREGLDELRRLLEREGHRVLAATRGADALALHAREPAQLIIVDGALDDLGGEEIVRRVRERDPMVPIVLQGRPPGGRVPRELLRRLDVQGYHDRADGADRLLVWVDAALRAHEQVAHFRVAERLRCRGWRTCS